MEGIFISFEEKNHKKLVRIENGYAMIAENDLIVKN